MINVFNLSMEFVIKISGEIRKVSFFDALEHSSFKCFSFHLALLVNLHVTSFKERLFALPLFGYGDMIRHGIMDNSIIGKTMFAFVFETAS